ncbi:hypothetical protein VEE59_17810 [Escherichia coli]|nr:hypothetical protein VEE59_17810 [Escherichia coli]
MIDKSPVPFNTNEIQEKKSMQAKDKNAIKNILVLIRLKKTVLILIFVIK